MPLALCVVAVRRRGLRAADRPVCGLFGVVGLLGMVACAPPKLPIRPDAMTPDESSVGLFFEKNQIPCRNYIDLGMVQGVAGEEPEPPRPGEEPKKPPEDKAEDNPTFEDALNWLKVATHQRGGSHVLVLGNRRSASGLSHLAFGMALRCPAE